MTLEELREKMKTMSTEEMEAMIRACISLSGCTQEKMSEEEFNRLLAKYSPKEQP